MKWKENSKEGIVVAGGRQGGIGLEQLLEPAKIIVSPWNTVYVADWGNHRVIRWPQGATQGEVVVARNGTHGQSNQLNHLTSLAFDPQGNLYVASQWSHTILKFDIERCP